jgi:hypothetical protein
MKKTSRPQQSTTDDLRPEYDFDYSKARPNPYAALLEGRAIAVILAPDVADAFPTSDSVNSALRAVLREAPRRVRARRRGKRRAG